MKAQNEGPTYPTVILQLLAQYPTIKPTTDQDTLIGRMLRAGGAK